ncbi:MAG TPA: hypothetical protein VIA45_00600 [Thermoanaerobaculia bacterium]
MAAFRLDRRDLDGAAEVLQCATLTAIFYALAWRAARRASA